MRTFYSPVIALAVLALPAATASAGILGDQFGLTFNYDVVSAESDALVFGVPGLLDNPPEQEWMVATAVGPPLTSGDLSLRFTLAFSDASDFDASLVFSLLCQGLADGSGVPLEIVGDIYLWFTPQMNPLTNPGVVLVEGVGWQQQQVAGDLRYQIGAGASITTLVPAAIAPSYFPGGHERITDVHWTFDVRNIPEPTTLLLLGGGVWALVQRRRR
jgi:hypothetical protein